MFDFFRNHIKIFMGLLMLLIIPSFVLFGVEGYTDFRNSAEPVAVVGRDKITQEQLDAAHRDDTERLLASMPQLDRAMLNSDVAQRATLERMLDERVLALAADTMHFTTSDQRLARELVQDPNIAALRQADGTLDVQRYQDLLKAQGLTPQTFEASLRANLARQQVTQGIVASVFVPTAVAQSALGAFLNNVKFKWPVLHHKTSAAVCNSPMPTCRSTTMPTRPSSKPLNKWTWNTWCWIWTLLCAAFA